MDDYQNSVMTKEKVENFNVIAVSKEEGKSKLLKKYNFYTIASTIETFKPSRTSIKFKSSICVLAENHYSLEGSAMSVANAKSNDKLIAVGRKIGTKLPKPTSLLGVV